MNLFQQYLAEEFVEDYTEGRLSWRDALKLIVSVTGSLLAANSILSACAPPPESVETIASTDFSDCNGFASVRTDRFNRTDS